MIELKDITPCLMVKNEDYWIYYVLKDLVDTFSEVIVLDTGSTDETKDIIRSFDEQSKIKLVEKDYGTNAELIGNGRNILRDLCPTHWMFLVDGDEIWTKPQLDALLSQDIPDNKSVIMAGNVNLEDVNGRLLKRTHDTANKDILLDPSVKWTRTDYPFEGYGLSNNLPMEKVHYFDAGKVYAWHVRHTIRSSKNKESFFRMEKYNYFPYDKGHEELPKDWIDVNKNFMNPYLLEFMKDF